MKHQIINVRGPSGSGKTTVARRLLTEHPAEMLMGSDGKIKGYHIDARSSGIKTPVYLVGSYANTCGGLDGINSQEEIASRIVKAYEFGHVLAEGLLTSKSSLGGHVAPILRDHGAIFAFLSTPLETCLERVLARRKAAGNDKEFDPKKSLISGWECCARSAELLTEAGGCDVRQLDWQNPYPQVLQYFKDAEND